MRTFLKIPRKFLQNISILIVSVFLALMIGEGITRIFCNPVDYLKPELVKDDILKVKIKPNSSGHDSWGFRNRSVPKKADIVTIGDSQTYGVSATANNSWPSILKEMTHKNVYNLALGGYGPIEYLYLLESKAILLNPSIIIVGFYFGNDLLDSYISVYNLDYYKNLRKSNIEKDQQQNINKEVVITENYNHKFAGNIRSWLSKHSVLYRITTFSIGNVFRFAEMKYIYPDKDVTIYEDKANKIHTCFTPVERLNSLNLKNQNVKEGLNLSLEAFDKIKQVCLRKNITLLVVLIPTKESVYSEYIENNSTLTNSQVINDLIINEREVTHIVKVYFNEHGIKYVDPLGSMKNAIGKTPPYQSGDSHPNKYGYGVIANVVYQGIKMNK
jgi:lysophospholipase L1-like esterase